MKNIVIKILAVLFGAIFLFYLFYSPTLKFDVLENPNKVSKPKEDIEEKKVHSNPKLTKGLGTYIGKNINSFTEKYGYPKRIYPSRFGYEHYVYQFKDKYYILGVEKKKIVMLYATGIKAEIYPYKVLEDAAHLFTGTAIDTEPIIKTKEGKYQFELSERDVKTQLLLDYDNVYMQIFVDRLTNKVMAAKYMTPETLVKLQPYAMSYNGDYIEKEAQQSKHTIDEVSTNSNNVLTLFELTNIMREIAGREPLETNEMINYVAQYQVAKLAVKEAKVKQVEDEIGKNLKRENIRYTNLAQNLAYDFEDLPSLVSSWLNSDEHREHLLNRNFTEMGGGISGSYTSLIFIQTADQ